MLPDRRRIMSFSCLEDSSAIRHCFFFFFFLFFRPILDAVPSVLPDASSFSFLLFLGSLACSAVMAIPFGHLFDLLFYFIFFSSLSIRPSVRSSLIISYSSDAHLLLDCHGRTFLSILSPTIAVIAARIFLIIPASGMMDFLFLHPVIVAHPPMGEKVGPAAAAVQLIHRSVSSAYPGKRKLAPCGYYCLRSLFFRSDGRDSICIAFPWLDRDIYISQDFLFRTLLLPWNI